MDLDRDISCLAASTALTDDVQKFYLRRASHDIDALEDMTWHDLGSASHGANVRVLASTMR